MKNMKLDLQEVKLINGLLYGNEACELKGLVDSYDEEELNLSWKFAKEIITNNVKQNSQIINYLEKEKIEVIKSSMLHDIKIKCGINENKRFVNNLSESFNNNLKEFLGPDYKSFSIQKTLFKVIEYLKYQENLYWFSRLNHGTWILKDQKNKTSFEKIKKLKKEINPLIQDKIIKCFNTEKVIEDNTPIDLIENLNDDLLFLNDFLSADNIKILIEDALKILNGFNTISKPFTYEYYNVLNGINISIVNTNEKNHLICTCPQFNNFKVCSCLIAVADRFNKYSLIKDRFINSKFTPLKSTIQLVIKKLKIDTEDNTGSGSKYIPVKGKSLHKIYNDDSTTITEKSNTDSTTITEKSNTTPTATEKPNNTFKVKIISKK